MSPENERSGPLPPGPPTSSSNDDAQPTAGLRRVEYAVDPVLLRAFDVAAQQRSAAARCIAAAVTAVATAAKLSGADHDELVQAVTAVRRELVHVLAGAGAGELADREWR